MYPLFQFISNEYLNDECLLSSSHDLEALDRWEEVIACPLLDTGSMRKRKYADNQPT